MEKDSNEFTFELTEYKSINFEQIFKNNNIFIGRKKKNSNKRNQRYQKLIKKAETEIKIYNNPLVFNSCNSFIVEQLFLFHILFFIS